MTNTTISDVKSESMFFGKINNRGKNKEVQGNDSFSQVFDKTQNSPEPQEKETAVKTEDTDNVQNHAKIQKNKTSESIKEQPEEVIAVKDEEKVEIVVTEAAEEMVEKIAETFDVTIEEVESVLETLGITALDLLNNENLTKVVLALNPECDTLTLMTNEELFADLKTLMNMAQEFKTQIAQNFNMSEEEMVQILNTLKEQTAVQMPAEEVVQETSQLSEVTLEAAEVSVTEIVVKEVVVKEVPVAERTAEEVFDEETTTLQRENESVEIKPMQDKEISIARSDADITKESELTNSNTYDGTVIQKTEISQDVHSHSSQAGEENGSANTAGQSLVQSFVNQLAEAVENAGQETNSYGVRGQDIINQITEHIRVHVKEDTTEMELQLHPASLGSVKVQLSSAGGVLTAVFTTENEAVKTALESQLIQLKENFAAQGLKVESVEVNVSAQGFERSLDQQEQEQRRFEENRSKRGNRRIRLNSVENSEDILTENISADDRIVADMMIRNGNTVDYTV